MLKYIAILIAGMSALSASASQAATSELCGTVRNYALATMEARQSGILSKALA